MSESQIFGKLWVPLSSHSIFSKISDFTTLRNRKNFPKLFLKILYLLPVSRIARWAKFGLPPNRAILVQLPGSGIFARISNEIFKISDFTTLGDFLFDKMHLSEFRSSGWARRIPRKTLRWAKLGVPTLPPPLLPLRAVCARLRLLCFRLHCQSV